MDARAARAGAVDAQLDVLRHRGPDARGWYLADSGAIGEARLAIIDLVTGDPPIANEDESIGVVLNLWALLTLEVFLRQQDW